VQWSADQLERASYRDLGSPAQVEERFYHHLIREDADSHARDAILELLQTPLSSTTRDYSVTLDTFELLKHDPILGYMLLRYPAALMPVLERAVVRAQQSLAMSLNSDSDQTIGHKRPHSSTTSSTSDKACSIKGQTGGAGPTTRVHARLVHLPPSHAVQSLGELCARHVGLMLQVSGTVVRCSTVQMYESARSYECLKAKSRGSTRADSPRRRFRRRPEGGESAGPSGCGHPFVVEADMELPNNALVQPEHCPRIIENGRVCGGTNLQAMGSIHTDYQEIKIQESASTLAVGRIPRSLLIKLRHDLVDLCQPGDEVVIVGSLLAQWHQPQVMPGLDCHVGVAMSAHSIRVVQEKKSSGWNETSSKDSMDKSDKFRSEFEAFWRKHESNPIQARDYICRAICPNLYGLQTIKLALLITLIGGYLRPFEWMGFRQVVSMALFSLKNTLNDLFANMIFDKELRTRSSTRREIECLSFRLTVELIICMSPCLLLEFSSRRLRQDSAAHGSELL
jgi:DNA replicative helicase MCM subunit Mcm2 (Cdc46/Mcm family)